MRLFALVLNAALLACIGFLFYKHGLPRGEDSWVLSLATAAPVVSLIALWLLPSKNLLGLYLQRKALEEQAKIDGLRKP